MCVHSMPCFSEVQFLGKCKAVSSMVLSNGDPPVLGGFPFLAASGSYSPGMIISPGLGFSAKKTPVMSIPTGRIQLFLNPRASVNI